MKYIHKTPTIVDALQFVNTEECINNLINLCSNCNVTKISDSCYCIIENLEQEFVVYESEWVIKTTDLYYFTLTDEEFNQSYKPLENKQQRLTQLFIDITDRNPIIWDFVIYKNVVFYYDGTNWKETNGTK